MRMVGWMDGCLGVGRCRGRCPYLENCYCGPEYVVEVFAIAFAERMFADNFGAGAFPLRSGLIQELAKLTAEQIHSQNAINPSIQQFNNPTINQSINPFPSSFIAQLLLLA